MARVTTNGESCVNRFRNLSNRISLPALKPGLGVVLHVLRQGFVPLAFLLLFTAFAALLGHDLYASYQQEYRVARRETENLSQLIERQVRSALEKSDIVLRQVVRTYTPAMTGQPRPDVLQTNRALREIMSTLPETQKDSLRIIDAEGHVVYSASDRAPLPDVFVGDRAYFLTQKNNPDAGLIVSEPILSRFTGKWLFTLSRRFSYPDGRFAGVAQTAVRADYLQGVFEAIDIGPHANVSLFDEKFRIVSRKPFLIDQLGKSFRLPEISGALAAGHKTGRYTVVSRVDAIYREYFFRQLEGLPFVLNIGFSPDDILAQWRQKAWLYGLSMLGMAILLTALAIVIRRAAHNRALQIEERFARESAEQASLAKTQFLAVISHELKTPLHGMCGMIEILRTTDGLDAEQRGYIEIAHECGRSLNNRISDILYFSQLETGQIHHETGPFDLAQCLHQVILMYNELATAKGLHLNLHTPDNLPACCLGDGPHLQQVLAILLDNAVKFTAHGEVNLELKITAKPGSTPEQHAFDVQCLVTDTGIGIPVARQSTLFSPFSLGDASNTRQQGGIGLGLAIAKRLSNLMGGNLALIASAENTGSRFCLTLPLVSSGDCNTPG